MVAELMDSIDPDERVIEVNEAFAVPLIDAAGEVLEKPLIGEIDCVVEKERRVALVDWKTSGRRWPKGKANKDLQPTALLYAYHQLHNETPTFRFTVVVKNKKPVVEHHHTDRGEDDFHRMVETVKTVEAMIAHEHFLPNEQGFFCANCQFQDACKAWHRDRNKLISTAA